MALKITFVKTGANSEKAIVGELTLFDGTTVLKKSTAFSGGNSFNPIDDGKYRLRLDVRGDEASNEANTDGTMKPYFGIQKVGTKVKDSLGNEYDMQTEWGTLRARLNPTGEMPDRGEYIHGKKRKRDYTHGCVCDRSEVVLKHLWDLGLQSLVLDVVVSGGAAFDLESLVPKNAGKRLKSKAAS